MSNEDSAAKSAEKGFSENELEDIMAEFESLETSVSSSTSDDDTVSEASEASEADDEDGFNANEMDAIMDDLDSFETSGPASQDDGILVISNELESKSKSSNVEFDGSGSMSFNISVDIAGEKAQLNVEDGKLKVKMNGVEISICEEFGCRAEIDGGINFSVPLGHHKSSKKVA